MECLGQVPSNETLLDYILTCIGLYYICALNIPDLSCPLFYFPMLNWGFDGFYDFCWLPIDEVVS